ncbi:hypothetical protein GH714_024206 [Hevea brasiliensis]|uniref:Uncharacterized protein n=1 Tax=Hevea brasiliensis TaxID=3981 RepID=A0A6A6KLS0_HEVBR|nr:hypothetical protein GH714_024206 [Hevea brasiliensis]
MGVMVGISCCEEGERRRSEQRGKRKMNWRPGKKEKEGNDGSCGSCGYPLNLTSSNRITSNIGSEYHKSIKKGFISFLSVDLSRFTQVDEVNCLPFYWGRYRSKTKLLCRKCGVHIDNGLSLVATGCPSLMVINLSRCNITDVGLEALANGCPALKQINLSYCPLVSDSGLRALSQACHQLQTVKMSCCREINGIGLTGCSPTLAYIDAESCNLETKGIMGIVSGGGLEYLNVSGISCSIHEDGLAAIGSGFATRLKILNLRMCRTVGDHSIMAIAKGCPLLQEWNLALCHSVMISGWKSIGSNCKKLEKLHVNRCRNLSDHGLQALREGCKRLSVLYISKCCRLSSTAIELFKLYRGNVEIREEEIMCVGPDWTIR